MLFKNNRNKPSLLQSMGLGSEVTKDDIICPYCGGIGKEYMPVLLKFIFPFLLLNPKYKCLACKELFNNPRKSNEAVKGKPSHLAKNIALAIIVLFILLAIIIAFI
jgi:DNA-directed RNA polymerase subunit RPC12/RpoP